LAKYESNIIFTAKIRVMEGFGRGILIFIAFGFWVGIGYHIDNRAISHDGPIEPTLEITVTEGVADTTWYYYEPVK